MYGLQQRLSLRRIGHALLAATLMLLAGGSVGRQNADGASVKQEHEGQAEAKRDRRRTHVLAFQRNMQVGTIDEYGKSLKILAEGALHYASRCWSPDQERLLFKTGKNDGHWSVCEVSLDNKKVRVIAENEPGGPCYWSKRGNTIITQVRRAEYELSSEGKRIWVNRTYSPDMKHLITAVPKDDGSSVALLSAANGEAGHVLVEIPDMRLEQFAFSPDCMKIAFAAEAVVKLGCDEGLANEGKEERPAQGIYVIDIDGKNLRCVVRDGFRPVWRPVGR